MLMKFISMICNYSQSTTNKGLERNIFGITPDEFQMMMPQFYTKLTGPFIVAEDSTNPPF